MAILPSQIVTEVILPRLPVKSLVRFKCVSKYSLISSPNFNPLHNLHIVYKNDVDSGHYYIDLSSSQTLPQPLALPDFFKPVSILGSCNGMLLYQSETLHYDAKYVRLLLINPLTGFYWSSGIIHFPLYGFGYGSLVDGYKFISLSDDRLMVISSTNKSSPRLISDNKDIVESIIKYGKFSALVNDHLSHWLIWCNLRRKHRIVCFDLCTETWTTDVPFPNYVDSDIGFEPNLKKGNPSLQVFDGCLSVLAHNINHTNCQVWVTKEYGVAESWVKLFTVPGTRFVPLAYAGGSRSKVLVKKGRGQLIWYDIKNEQSNKADFHEIHGAGLVICMTLVCLKEALRRVFLEDGFTIQRWAIELKSEESESED